MAALKLLSALVLCILVTAPPLNHAMKCDEVMAAVAPCTEYVASRPTEACCRGMQTVSNAENTTANRQAICNCLKESGGSLVDRSAILHADCGIKENFPIATINCSE